MELLTSLSESVQGLPREGEADDRTDGRAENQLPRGHVTEQRRHHLEQLKAFKDELVRDLLTQLSPQSSRHLRPSPVPSTNLSLPSPPYNTPPRSATVTHSPKSLLTHTHPPLTPPRGSPRSPLTPSRNVSPGLPPSHPHSHTSHHFTPPPTTTATSFETVISPPVASQTHPQSTHHHPSTNLGPQGHQYSIKSPQTSPPLPRMAWVGNTDNSTSLYSETRAKLTKNHSRHVEDLESHREFQQMKQADLVSGATTPVNEPKSPSFRRTALSLQVNTPVLKSPDTHLSLPRTKLHYALPSSPAPQSPRPPEGPQSLRPPEGPQSLRHLEKLATENEQLKTKCSELQSELQQTNMVNRAIETQLERQQQYWLEWQSQAETYSRTIDVLQDKLDASRTQLKQQDSLVEQLQSDLQMSVGEIQFWKEQRTQEAAKLKQVCVELEELKGEKETLESGQESLREELMSVQRELGKAETAARTSALLEQELKSTIQKLETRIRHLEHVNNRLHGQATHYSLGSSFPNSPDDDKLCHRPRSASHTPSHPPSAHTPTQSPGHTLTPPHPHTPTSTNHNSHTSSQRSPFIRRKWLQPSDPGLIFGTPPPSHPHSSPPHRSPAHYQSDTRSPRLQSTGQAIARQLSDSGSSNEGEDPTSLSRRTYINSGREGPQSGEDGLVGSTLSAIQNGRIKTDSTATGERSKKKVERESVQERVRRSMHVVAEAEERLAQLHREKENLESVLQRTLRQGGRVTRQSKQAQLEMERRLEEVLREIGSVKMTLRSHHAFHK